MPHHRIGMSARQQRHGARRGEAYAYAMAAAKERAESDSGPVRRGNQLTDPEGHGRSLDDAAPLLRQDHPAAAIPADADDLGNG